MFLDLPVENEQYRDFMMNYNDPVYSNSVGGKTFINEDANTIQSRLINSRKRSKSRQKNAGRK